jgi:hypothetical protein
MDHPSSILRKLKDNVGQYAVEAVAEIRQTHRFRGKWLAGLALSTANWSRPVGFSSVYDPFRFLL